MRSGRSSAERVPQKAICGDQVSALPIQSGAEQIRLSRTTSSHVISHVSKTKLPIKTHSVPLPPDLPVRLPFNRVSARETS